jgi:hypothetical protein
MAPSGTGRNATAVVLAAAVLAVVGAVFGVVLGTQATGSSNRPDGGGTTTTPGSQPATTPAGKPCPGFIRDAATKRGAKEPLIQILYIESENRDRNSHSEVWICRDEGGRGKLWYQGHRIDRAKYPDEVPVEGRNGLLLNQVNSTGDQFIAVNTDAQGNRTTYTVSKTELAIVQPRDRWTERVLVHDP